MNCYKLLNKIKNSKNVCIITHVDPDTDALASAVVLRNFLIKKFKIANVDIFAEATQIDDYYKPILQDLEINKKVSNRYDTAIMLDAPNTDRLGKYVELFSLAKLKFVIDHHATNTYCGDYNIVEFVSSTCEIIYKILSSFKYKFSVKDYENIYAGIITDTNNFSVGATDFKTFKIASACVLHIDHKKVYNHYLNNVSLKQLKLMSVAINNIKMFENEKVLVSTISQDDANLLKANFDDYNGIVNYISKTNTAKIVCLILPKNNSYYVSLRSKDDVDIGSFAKKNNGGGHKCAAAYISEKSIETITNNVVDYYKSLNIN